MKPELHKESKDQILTAFRNFFQQYQKTEIKVETKEEVAEKEKNKELLKIASTYTVDNIVNGMASLQLDFGNIVQSLEDKLASEVDKLDELKRAIIVESQHLEKIKKVRLVADALYILRQEHQEKIRLLTETINEEKENLSKEEIGTKKAWQKEQEDFELKIKEESELINKEREKEKENYDYELKRERKIESDEYEEAKRTQERELMEEKKEKEKDWAEREAYLEDNKAEFEETKTKIEGFEEKLKQDYNKAKGDAIKDAEKDAKVKLDLIEKEWESTQQGYELKIQALESTIERQTEQIENLMAQLQEATNQGRSLAIKAFEGSNGNS